MLACHAFTKVKFRHVRAHPEDRQDVDGRLEEQWEGRPEPRGLKGAVR